MAPMDDRQLIESYAREKSEPAFRALVERHAGLVHSSALRQVHDAQLAQDVTQAVFILLARKAGSLRRGTILQGWLFQTTRFVALRAARSEHRRQRREQEAFDMQQLNSADEAWRQMAPVIDEALAQLSHADRDAILLRYMDGRSLREVSVSLGVTEEAAKKRVARAVERLRQTVGKNGVVISAGLVGAALTSHATAAIPATLVASLCANAVTATSTSGAVAAMVSDTLAAWRWIKLKWFAGAGVSAVVVLLLVTMNRAANPNAADPANRAPIAGLNASAGAALQPATLPSPPGIAQRNDPNARHLRLRVVSAETGGAISNARVAFSVWRYRNIETNYSLKTDAAGVCDLAYASDAGRIDVGVLQNGWAARYATWPSEGLPGIPAEYELRLARVTNSIGGFVRDPQGRPLADVQIDFQGRDSGDHAQRERPRERFGFIWAVPATRTDQQGHWSLAYIPPANRGFAIEAYHPDFADTTLVSSPAQEGLDKLEEGPLQQLWAGQLISTMNTALTLTGAVVDEQHRPIAGAKILEREQSDVWSTDATGQFRVPKLKEGQWSFTVTAEGFAPVRTNALISAAVPPALVVLRTGAVLRVRVIDELGIEVPDAEVGMEQWGENRNDIGWRENTGFDGRIEWRSAPRDVELQLYAHKDGFCYTRDVQVRADGEEHTIKIQRVLQVFGRVVDAETGRAIRDFKAMPAYGGHRYGDNARWFSGETVRGTNGIFKLTFKEKQFPWELRLIADGYEDWTSAPLTNRVQAELDIAMKRSKPENSVRGAVLLPDGAPAAGAQVALLTFEHNVTLRDQSFDGNNRWITKTGERGEFSFPANRLAHSVAAVGAAGYAHLRVRDVREAVTLRLQPWGRVEGTVDESAATLGVLNVQLYDPATANYKGSVSLLSSGSAKPDANRHFVFESVPPGEFCVYVNSQNGIPFHHQTPVLVEPGQTTSVVIREWPGTRITGRFTPPPGRTVSWRSEFITCQFYADLPSEWQLIGNVPANERPMRELEFWTSPAGREQVNTPRVYSGYVRDDGSFVSLENLPPGKYRLTTVFKNCSATRDITVSDEQPKEMALGEIPLR